MERKRWMSDVAFMCAGFGAAHIIHGVLFCLGAATQGIEEIGLGFVELLLAGIILFVFSKAP